MLEPFRWKLWALACVQVAYESKLCG